MICSIARRALRSLREKYQRGSEVAPVRVEESKQDGQGFASVLTGPVSRSVPATIQKVSYFTRFTKKPLPVRVFQQVIPLKRLVQAMFP